MTESISDIYGAASWGDDLTTILDNGDLALVDPQRPDALPVSLPAIVQNLEERGIQSPVLVRVASYLQAAIDQLNQSFAAAIEGNGYRGVYRGVFPIKVNQQAQVIDRIVKYGSPYSYGLEAGSKAELIVAMSQNIAPDALIICNGVKDRAFIELAIRSRQLGMKTIIVLESRKEVELVLQVAEELGMEPLLGVRVKLTHRISGKWQESSGERSRFGLSIDQIVEVVDELRAANMLHCLTLQHAHLGSQIPNVNDVRRAVTEACRVFTELSNESVPLEYLDIGGGLGIDYTGQKSNLVNSVNYTIDEYCNNVIEAVGYAMDEAGVAHPTIVNESGRAVVARSSLMVFNVLEATHYDAAEMPPVDESDHAMIRSLAEITAYLEPDRLQECLNDARYYKDELRTLFSYGQISIRDMAKGEQIFLHISALIKNVAHEAEGVDDLDEKLAQLVDIYHCNFSLFQSLPDVWGIDQVHPVIPLQRLNEVPQRRAILADITCDSDGRVESFVTENGTGHALPVHDLREGEPYYIGVFFVGAYQETLGDLHNLFGDTNVVTIELNNKGGFDLLHEVEGDTIAEVMSYVEYNIRACTDTFKARVEQAMTEGRITVKDRRQLIRAYKTLMDGYTYFEGSDAQA